MKLIKNLKQKSFPLYLHRRNVTNKHHTALPWTDDGLTNTKPRFCVRQPKYVNKKPVQAAQELVQAEIKHEKL